jgi:hypothetical protein
VDRAANIVPIVEPNGRRGVPQAALVQGEGKMTEVIQLQLSLAALLGCLFGVAMTLVAMEFLRRRETAEIERAGIWRVGPRAYRLGRLDNEGMEEMMRRRKEAEAGDPVVKMPPLRSSTG